MSVRSLNKVMLIGNLTRDPELRFTPSGTAVCSFGLATNRSWTTEAGEKKEDTEFHRIVSWNKLAELCSQLLTKGRKVFVEGRLQTRSWTGQDGNQRQSTEIVIDDMIILDSKRFDTGATAVPPAAPPVDLPKPAAPQASATADTGTAEVPVPPVPEVEVKPEESDKRKKPKKDPENVEAKTETEVKEDINPDDIPF